MPVPFKQPIQVTKTTLPPLPQYHALLQEIWTLNWVTNNGPKCQELEEKLAARLDTDCCLLVSNGTIALQLAIKALGLSGSVVTTPFSYVATTNSLLWEGMTPIFADVETEYFTIDPELVEAAIRPDTTAILATHVYGYPCQHEALQAIADKHGLSLIYDAAHAFGVRLDGQSVLRWGDISTLSFHATKVFHTIEGGGLVCRTPDMKRQVGLLRSFGHVGADYQSAGINGKTSELNAAIGLLNLETIDEQILARQRVHERYQTQLVGSGFRCLSPKHYPGLTYNYAYFPIVCQSYEEREAVVAYLNEHNVFPRKYFDPSLNTLPFLDADLRTPCPVSEKAAQTVLCLPFHPEMTDEEVDRIAQMVVLAVEKENV
ncbi:DegT/DnrJ/EryC1/StrS family aminotransferase [Neolewinella antarctica]|uniref:dTDP-4-amino-4,6-dideoxygalactose transaminase n=1 Tax=Neolewinella antarctica TaxID=442734 RepID=A0ABX0XBD5_9BACT|nr:DegT/DnrJ/EryC1/StrS family aminotransferase [Neolewinella antarctica]NJC26148.1 dTDP-4-amino-4,6-dideoxygalactose transaminase [Neolewinella antarctica]